MRNTYNLFKESVKEVTRYYLLLVEETRSERLVGSTNEWVLDNYYMISEQEKVMKAELKGVESGKWRVESKRVEILWKLLEGYLKRSHHAVDKELLFRYLRGVQLSTKDYLSYPEVWALLPLMKAILIAELPTLCRELEATKAYHYRPTDRSMGEKEHLDAAAKQNLMMMNIFNSLKKLSKLPMAELIDAISFSEKALKGEKAGMYDEMQDKTKEDYRVKIVRLSHKQKRSEYELVKELVAKADKEGRHVGWDLFPPKRWNLRAHWYIWIVATVSLALACGFAHLAVGSYSSNMGSLWWLVLLLTVFMAVPMSQVVIDLFNQLLYRLHKPVGTFKLKFKDGLIPKEYATMVIMPTILKNKEKTVELLEQLEVY